MLFETEYSYVNFCLSACDPLKTVVNGVVVLTFLNLVVLCQSFDYLQPIAGSLIASSEL